MDKKIRKGAKNKVLGIVLCLSLILGMSMVKTVSAGNVEGALEAYDASINTTDYTRAAGNAIAYNSNETYVIGSIQLGSGINFVSGVAMDLKFSRAIGDSQTTANSNGEWFTFKKGTDMSIDDSDNLYTVNYLEGSDNKKVITSTDQINYSMYVGEDKYCQNAAIASAVRSSVYATPFIIELHNLKSDLEITYTLKNEKMAYNTTANYNDVVAFDNNTSHIRISNTKIEIASPTLTFNVTDGCPTGYAFSDVASVSNLTAGNKMPAEKIPAAPAMTTGVDDLNFAGWYTNATGTLSDANKLTKDSVITESKTYYARWTNKVITLSWNDDSLKKIYGYGGEQAGPEALASKVKCGAQLNFTLTIDGVSYNTADTLDAAGKALVNKVIFLPEYSSRYAGLVGQTNKSGKSYRVVDMEPGGMAWARYSGIVRLKLQYLSSAHQSGNESLQIVSGDVDGNGVVAMGDLTLMTKMIKNGLDSGAVGSATEYYKETADMDANGSVALGDLTRATKCIKETSTAYNTSFKNQ